MPITLPTELEQSLQQLAQATGEPFEILVQQAVQDFLVRHQAEKTASLHPCIGMGKSGMPDLAQRDEELLWSDK